jgi:SAM-dependent methyltransferase
VKGILNVKLGKKDWYPTKYEFHRGRWRGKRDWPVGSRIVEDLQAAGYERTLKEHARGRLVDLGCGNAPLAGIYIPHVDEYLWVDWSVSQDGQIFELDYEVNLNGPLPFGDAEFDTVVLSDVLEHIAEPDNLLTELARITRPNGNIIIGVPFLYCIHEKPYDYYRYTRFKLEQLAAKNGLLAIQINEVGGALDVWSDLSSKLAQYIWSPLSAIPYYLWLSTKWIPVVHKLNQKTAWKFPLAYAAVFRKPSVEHTHGPSGALGGV